MLGDGSLHQAMLRKIRQMGLSDVVATPGYVPGIDPWLRKADAFLCTSHFEGGPAVAVEALAHGVPVISTDCSHFLHDIMTIPEAGTLVPTRNPQDLAQAVIEVTRRGPPRWRICRA
jgi:glycosyltransferase involved in cell wall biosynthesis